MTTEAFLSTRPTTRSGSVDDTETPICRSMSTLAHELAEHEGRNDPDRTAQIRRWCDESAERFRDAPIQAYVSVLVHHIVRERMSTS